MRKLAELLESRRGALRASSELGAFVGEYGRLLHAALDLVEDDATLSISKVRALVDQVGAAVAEASEEHRRRQNATARETAAGERERLGDIFEHAPAIIGHVTGPKHVFSFANRWFTQLVGGRPLVGLPFIEAMPELVNPVFMDLLDRVYATGEPFIARALPASLDRTGGGAMREGLFDFIYQPTRDEAGQVEGVFIHAVEVTELSQRDRRLADVDESLRAAEEQRNELSLLLRQAPVAITLFRGPKHIIEVANPGVCRLWGRTEAQVMGKPLFEALPEAAGQGFEALLAEVLSSGTPFVGTELLARLIRVEGGALEDVYIDFVYQPLLDARGKVHSILVVANEVTERVRARAIQDAARHAAEAERARLYELFMLVPALVAVLRGPSHVFELVNPAYKQSIGGREVLGLAFREALPDLAGQGFAELIDQVNTTGEPFVGTEVLVQIDPTASGTSQIRYYDFVCRAFRDTLDTANGVLIFAIDVTSQVEARQKLQDVSNERKALLDDARVARAQAERANQAMDEFLATVSHELRTPLNAMLGWARLLRSDHVSEAQRPKALETIERNARVQSQLIEDLLDVSRIISGKMRLEVGDVELASVLEAALDVVRPAADAKGIHLEAIIDVAASHVTGDGSRLQQVAWNLLSNAIKFTPKGGRVELRLSSAKSFVEITVTDSGQGIEAAFLDHVFERFRQGDGATTRAHGGLGLGLAIVKNIVELHGGTIRAASEGLGRGASFIVQLPLLIAPEASLPSAPNERTSGTKVPPESVPLTAGLRILVVDDEEDARDLLVTLLQRAGAVVTAVGSAREAVAAVQRERPAVVVSDIGMPGEDGFALIRQIRALDSEQSTRTPVVALTAFARPEDRRRALSEGFDDHVAKPIEPAELFAAIATLTACGDHRADGLTTRGAHAGLPVALSDK